MGRSRPAQVIVADTSAVVAIAFGEPERPAFLQAIPHADKALVSSVSVAEARMVVHGRRGQRAVILVDGSNGDRTTIAQLISMFSLFHLVCTLRTLRFISQRLYAVLAQPIDIDPLKTDAGKFWVEREAAVSILARSF